MKNCAMFQKRIALHEIYIYCFQSSEALGGFWSFLKFYMYIQIETFMYAITSHKKQRAKYYQTEMLSRIANRETAIQVQVMFSAKQHPDCRHRRPEINCDNADGHSQTGNRKKKCRQVEFERQAVRTKATRSALRLCLHTVDRTFIYTNFLLLWIWQI